MAPSPEVVKALQAAHKAAFDLINKREVRLLGTQKNFDAMRFNLQEQGLSLEQMANPAVWVIAFTECDAAGELEQPPPPEVKKTRAEIEAEWTARDKFPGSPQGNINRAAETPRTEAEKRAMLKQALINMSKHEHDKIHGDQEAKERAAVKYKADHDTSSLPTVDQIADGAQLTGEQMAPMSAAQVREYTRRCTAAQNELYRRQNQAIKDAQKAKEDSDGQ